jgi:hypothetical protein
LRSISEHLVAPGACAKDLRAVSDVSSVEASLTTMTSRGLYPCTKTDWIASGRNRDMLYEGITTLTRGASNQHIASGLPPSPPWARRQESLTETAPSSRYASLPNQYKNV